jgi:hypothetical protein
MAVGAISRLSICALLLCTGIGGRAARNSEQVVFSGQAGPVGFWIWCEADSTNPYAGECNGAMYFYNLGISQHVIDVVAPQETAEGVYTLTVMSTGKDAVACTLSNTAPPVNGPRNTVNVKCTTPTVSATTDTAVVIVTGP